MVDRHLNERLNTLAKQAWKQFHDFEELGVVAKKSIPVLYFGDIHAYMKSPCRIITVGKNPSKIEFEDGHIPMEDVDEHNPRKYLDIMNDYFKPHRDPYRWFDNYEWVLNGMKASYYGAKTRTAVHTDLCSPLATKRNWSNLAAAKTNEIQKRGTNLWRALARCLEPDIIIASFKWSYLAEEFSSCRWTRHVIPEKDYEIRMCETDKYGETTVFFGRASQSPFGPGLTHLDQEDVGKFLVQLFRKRLSKKNSSLKSMLVR
jgi:hypothetical protein